MIRKLAVVGAIVMGVVALVAGPAFAHVEIERAQRADDEFYRRLDEHAVAMSASMRAGLIRKEPIRRHNARDRRPVDVATCNNP